MLDGNQQIGMVSFKARLFAAAKKDPYFVPIPNYYSWIVSIIQPNDSAESRDARVSSGFAEHHSAFCNLIVVVIIMVKY